MLLVEIQTRSIVGLFIYAGASFLQLLRQRFRSAEEYADSCSAFETGDYFRQLHFPIGSTEFSPVMEVGKGVVGVGSISRSDLSRFKRIPSSSQEDVIGEEFVVARRGGSDGDGGGGGSGRRCGRTGYGRVLRGYGKRGSA